ncbi:acyl-CoA thioesterase [Myxococcota bacterium]|nr:acyl-CoA thioesterase [Myxococcota bacterium]
MPLTFRHSVRVEFDEVDLYGIVHHARYFIYMERARVAMLRSLGAPPGDVHGRGFGLVLVEDRTRYRTPARLSDVLDVHIEMGRLGAASMRLDYRITRGEDVVVESEIRLACVGPDGRPRTFPPEFRAVLEPP